MLNRRNFESVCNENNINPFEINFDQFCLYHKNNPNWRDELIKGQLGCAEVFCPHCMSNISDNRIKDSSLFICTECDSTDQFANYITLSPDSVYIPDEYRGYPLPPANRSFHEIVNSPNLGLNKSFVSRDEEKFDCVDLNYLQNLQDSISSYHNSRNDFFKNIKIEKISHDVR